MASMTEPTPAVPEPTPEPTPAPAPAGPSPDLGDRMKALGDELGTRGQQLGREAQAAGERWSRDPGVVRVANDASRVWGLVLLIVGAYFFVEVTLGYSLPRIPWGEIWPAFIILLGLIVITRGMTRRS